MKKYGKKYRAVIALVDKKKKYSMDEGIDLLTKTSVTKFDSSAEVHIHLGIDTKQAEQNVRGIVVLPHGTGKDIRVIAFVTEDKIKEAKASGASEAGEDELVEKIVKGWMDFDIAVATPDVMKKLGKVAKILGQKGLMPNPKAGTITSDIGKTISTIKKGQIEYRNDKNANLHNLFGKISFGSEKLKENLKNYLKAVTEAKPSTIKGTYIQSITLATTMGPGIKLDSSSVLSEIKS